MGDRQTTDFQIAFLYKKRTDKFSSCEAYVDALLFISLLKMCLSNAVFQIKPTSKSML